jgi:phage shock protein A
MWQQVTIPLLEVSMLRRWIQYISTSLGMKAQKHADPRVEVEMAMQDARKRDAELREQATRVIAHRTELQLRAGKALEGCTQGEARATAALRKAEAARASGDAAEADRWERAALEAMTQLQGVEAELQQYRDQFDEADRQAEAAKAAVVQNAERLRELGAKRLEVLGRIEHVEMQEQFTKAVASLSSPLSGEDGSNFAGIEQRLDTQLAQTRARAELHAATSGDHVSGLELDRAMRMDSAAQRLEQLRGRTLEQGTSAGELPEASGQ